MPEFLTAADGAHLRLDATEARLLMQLTSEFKTILSGGRLDRGDPIYDRLFPSAYEKPEDETAYRELTGDDLSKHKLEALDIVVGALDKKGADVTLEGEDFDAWLQILTDLRLAIGTSLDVDEERMGAEVDPHDADAPALQILHWLGWVQEGLIEARGNLLP